MLMEKNISNLFFWHLLLFIGFIYKRITITRLRFRKVICLRQKVHWHVRIHASKLEKILIMNSEKKDYLFNIVFKTFNIKKK